MSHADTKLRSTRRFISSHRHQSPLAQLSSAQDLIFGARIDERVRLERERMKLPARQPRYHPTSPPTPLPGKAEQAVATQRAQQWIEQERTRYFANPTAPLVPRPAPSQ